MVTTAPASIPMTTPSPNVWCRTESPVPSAGWSRNGMIGDGRLPPVVPLRRREPLAHDTVLGQLVEEARRQVVRAVAEQHPRRGVREAEPLLRTRQADVAEAPLLLDPLLLDGARVREEPLLHPDHEHGAELEALRVVQRHQRHERAVAARARPGRSTARSPAGTTRATAPARSPRTRARRRRAPAGSPCVLAPRSSAPPRVRRGSRSARARAGRGRERSAPAPARSATGAACSASCTFLSGAAPTPASSARASACHSQIPCASANVTSRAIDESPMPRRGRFAMRISDTASAGLSSTCRYAIRSLISARS